MLVQLSLCTGLGLLLAALNVYFRDLQQILNVLMLAGFFLTPVVYPLESITDPAIRQAMLLLNPMAALITGYRQILYAGGPLNLPMLGVTTLEAGLALLVGLVVFRRLSPAFAEEI
jgi:ABC-2 type transport system permease protein